jgi:ankyrin repeat protein
MDFATRIDTLIAAACNGDMATANALLEAEPDLGRGNFYAACVTGEYEAAAKYLEREPAMARTSGGPETMPPLLYLCYSRFLADPQRAEAMLRIATLLLDRGANPNAFFISPDDNETREAALYGAAGINRSPELTALLLARGADPNDGESLYHASEGSDHACLKLLLDAGPEPAWKAYCLGYKLWMEDLEGARLFLDRGTDPNIRAQAGVLAGCAALHVALRRRRSAAIVELLLEGGADPIARDRQDFSPLQLAVRFGLPEAAELLLKRGANPADVTPTDRLLGACWREDETEARSILANHPRLAAGFGEAENTAVCDAAQFGMEKALKLMFDVGLDPSTASYDAMNALHWGAFYGHAGVVEVCLRQGVPMEERNSYGGTALATALYSALALQRGDAQAPPIRLLLDAGADPAPIRACPFPTGYPELDALLGPILESWPSEDSSSPPA